MSNKICLAGFGFGVGFIFMNILQFSLQPLNKETVVFHRMQSVSFRSNKYLIQNYYYIKLKNYE